MIECNRDPVFVERLDPRACVRVVAVDQRAVDVEDHGCIRTHSVAPFVFLFLVLVLRVGVVEFLVLLFVGAAADLVVHHLGYCVLVVRGGTLVLVS
jgi:hypothetical protein